MDDNTTGSKSIGEQLFQLRDYTPLPLIALMLFTARPTVLSATLGTLIVCLGELFRIYSVAFIGAISRTRKSSLGDRLVVVGPFKWVRNPLYVGNFLIVLGVGVFTAKLWFVLLAAGLFAGQYYYIVQYEESLLELKFGADYQLYKTQVPAWIPKQCPRLAEIEWPASFSDSLYSERRTLAAIVAVLLVLVLVA